MGKKHRAHKHGRHPQEAKKFGKRKLQAAAPPPHTNADADDDDAALVADGAEFVEANAGAAASFVASVDTSMVRAGKRSRPEPEQDARRTRRDRNAGDDSALEDTVRAPPREWSEAEARERALPLKLSDGTVTLRPRPAEAQGMERQPVVLPSRRKDVEQVDDDDEASEAGDGSDAEGAGVSVDAEEDEDAYTAVDDVRSFQDWRKLAASARLQRRKTLRASIAAMAETILADPEHTVYAGGPKPRTNGAAGAKGRADAETKRRSNVLADLQQLCGDADPVIRKLAMLSCVAVFADIAPGYRIRDDEDGAKTGTRMKKDTKRLLSHEKALLKCYQRFLKYCEATALLFEQHTDGAPDSLAADSLPSLPAAADESSRPARIPEKEWREQKKAERKALAAAKHALQRYDADAETIRGLAVSAVSCMCELLKRLPHFNFRSNLIAFIVPRMSARDEEMATLCTSAIEEVFAADESGDGCAEIVRTINQHVKETAKHRPQLLALNPAAILVLTKLKLASHLQRADTSRETAQRGAQAGAKAKRGKMAGNPYDENDVLAGLHAADAEALEERKKQAGAALTGVITICFRLLRADGAGHLLAATLAVMSRIAHLIDVDVTKDVLVTLRELLQDTVRRVFLLNEEAGSGTWSAGAAQSANTKLTVAASLNCIITALRIISGPGEILNVDDAPFASALFATLLRLLEPDQYRHAALAADAIRTLGAFRSMTPQRSGSFVKRCLFLSACLPTPAAAALLHCARWLCARHVAAASVYRPPEDGGSAAAVHCGALADLMDGRSSSVLDLDRTTEWRSSAWECAALLQHYHPAIRTMCLDAAKLVPLAVSETPEQAYSAYDDSTGSFNPPVPVKASGKHTPRLRRGMPLSPWLLESFQGSVASTAMDESTDNASLMDEAATEPAFTTWHRRRLSKSCALTRRVLLRMDALRTQHQLQAMLASGIDLGELQHLLRGMVDDDDSDDSDYEEEDEAADDDAAGAESNDDEDNEGDEDDEDATEDA